MINIELPDGSRKEVDEEIGRLIENLVKKNKRYQSTIEDVESLIANFRENYITCDLIRIGGDGDGGYLVPPILDQISFCFSPGVSDIANFEMELSDKYNIKSFMADASIELAPCIGDNFEFSRLFINPKKAAENISLSDWIYESIGENSAPKILQMDIEGDEYDTLIYEDASLFSSFSIMVIEFHFMQRLIDRHFLRMFSAVLEKILKNFCICHVHPNNNGGVTAFKGIKIPNIIEVTFVHRDLVPKIATDASIELPHPLDQKNMADIDDLRMPPLWWRQE